MKFYLSYAIVLLLVSLSICSCVEDTDFDQGENVQLTPEVELDLIFFNLVAEDFFDEATQTPRLVIRDTTALEFLDGNDINSSIRRIDFFFDFKNTIPRQFNVDFEFLTIGNTTTYTTGTVIQQGQNGSEVQTIFEEVVEDQDLLDLLQSRKVVVSVTIPEANDTLEGTLNLKSKTTYFLEFE